MIYSDLNEPGPIVQSLNLLKKNICKKPVGCCLINC